MRTFICKQCNKEFTSKKACKSNMPKYCSNECYSKTLIKTRYCQFCGNEIKAKGKRKNKKYCSKECRQSSRKGTNLSAEWCKALSDGRKKSERCKGPNLYNWKGGTENTRKRNVLMYHKRRGQGSIDSTYLKFLFFVQKGKCYYCGDDIREKGQKAIEHLIPISRGGDNEWINIVYSCKFCNSKKRTKTLAEFAIEQIRPDWLNNMSQFIAKKMQQKHAG